MVAMARRIVASEVMVRCVISNAPTGRERLSRAMTALDSLPASNARPARAANRPSPSKMATLSPNSDAMVSATASILPVRDNPSRNEVDIVSTSNCKCICSCTIAVLTL